MSSRPAFIKNYQELPNDGGGCYPGTTECLSIGTPLSRPLGLTRLGIHHEVLLPGHRTSWPHAESEEEECIYVLEGNPSVWVNGTLYPLAVGDVVAFVPGTGITHTFINQSSEAARLLVVGEKLASNRCYYPFHPEGWEGMPESLKWIDPPLHPMGEHLGTANFID